MEFAHIRREDVLEIRLQGRRIHAAQGTKVPRTPPFTRIYHNKYPPEPPPFTILKLKNTHK